MHKEVDNANKMLSGCKNALLRALLSFKRRKFIFMCINEINDLNEFILERRFSCKIFKKNFYYYFYDLLRDSK